MTKPFANLTTTDPRTLAQQELAELTDWQRRLGNADYKFSESQWNVIFALASPADRAEVEDVTEKAKYALARKTIPAAIEERQRFLGIAEPKEAEIDELQA
jgi:hypothetical protein